MNLLFLQVLKLHTALKIAFQIVFQITIWKMFQIILIQHRYFSLGTRIILAIYFNRVHHLGCESIDWLRLVFGVTLRAEIWTFSFLPVLITLATSQRSFTLLAWYRLIGILLADYACEHLSLVLVLFVNFYILSKIFHFNVCRLPIHVRINFIFVIIKFNAYLRRIRLSYLNK